MVTWSYRDGAVNAIISARILSLLNLFSRWGLIRPFYAVFGELRICATQQRQLPSSVVLHVLPAVQIRRYLATKSAVLHGCKRETAALTAMRNCIAPTPRQGCASPGCMRPQPALDPATGRCFCRLAEHFSGSKKTRRQICADFDRHSQHDVGEIFGCQWMVRRRFLTVAKCAGQDIPRDFANGWTEFGRLTAERTSFLAQPRR